MNILKQFYCRVFQFGFKVAIPMLPYRNPFVLHSITQVPGYLKQNGCSSVLLVTDRSIRGFGITKHLEELLKNENIRLTVYDGVTPNPTVAEVEEARGLYLAHKCNALIGFGGGSSMDTAKAVGALIARPDARLSDLGGMLRVWKQTPLTIAIPTTAGTGSETTVAAIVQDQDTKHKYALMDFPLIPDAAVLDPENTRTVPPAVTAGTGADVIVHAVEAYIGNSTTKITRREALRAVRLSFKYLRRAYRNGNDMKARRGMARASYLAGAAFTVSYVGYAHAVSHSLSGRYNVPHGQTCGILLPYVLRSYGKKINPQLHALAIAAGVASKYTAEDEAARKFLDALDKLWKDIGIPSKVKELKEMDIEALARQADKEGNPVYPVPRLMNAKELEKFYRAVLP